MGGDLRIVHSTSHCFLILSLLDPVERFVLNHASIFHCRISTRLLSWVLVVAFPAAFGSCDLERTVSCSLSSHWLAPRGWRSVIPQQCGGIVQCRELRKQPAPHAAAADVSTRAGACVNCQVAHTSLHTAAGLC